MMMIGRVALKSPQVPICQKQMRVIYKPPATNTGSNEEAQKRKFMQILKTLLFRFFRIF